MWSHAETRAESIHEGVDAVANPTLRPLEDGREGRAGDENVVSASPKVRVAAAT